jgi:hypothetical protein
MSVIRPARQLVGTRKATRPIASSSGIPIYEDYSFSNGTNLITIFDFLSMLQRTPKIVWVKTQQGAKTGQKFRFAYRLPISRG